jgi:hypothetical protein
MKPLPEKWQKKADALSRKHADRGWKDIRIGVPDNLGFPTPSIFVHATSPSEERKHCTVRQDEAGFEAIERFLESSNRRSDDQGPSQIEFTGDDAEPRDMAD